MKELLKNIKFKILLMKGGITMNGSYFVSIATSLIVAGRRDFKTQIPEFMKKDVAEDLYALGYGNLVNDEKYQRK